MTKSRSVVDLRGKYVSFLDSDDRISSNAFEEAYHFLEKYEDGKWTYYNTKNGKFEYKLNVAKSKSVCKNKNKKEQSENNKQNEIH